jgi:ABC-2 type transport system ATP-binding protein
MDKGRIIREGSPQELKDCCGGETQVKLRLFDRNQISRTSQLLQEISEGKVHIAESTGEISLPATGGTVTLSAVVDRLKGAGIQISEIGLQQPTLDDVFLAITGHTAEEEAEKTSTASKTLGKR